MQKYLLIAPVVCICFSQAYAKNTENIPESQDKNYTVVQDDIDNSGGYNYRTRYERTRVNYDDLYIDPNRYKSVEEPKNENKDHLAGGYIGVGLVGQSIEQTFNVGGTEVAKDDISSFGINLNGGLRTRYFRLGLDVSGTTGDADESGMIPDYIYGGTVKVSDIDIVKYSIELGVIIKCGDMVDIEIGGTVGRGRYKVAGNWSEWVTPYGFILGVGINFNDNHALILAFKGYTYSTDGNTYGYNYETKANAGEFTIGYRYSF